MESKTPRLHDLINDWRLGTPQFAEWNFVPGSDGCGGACCRHFQMSYLNPPGGDKRGCIQIWDDHVVVILAIDTLSMITASEHYRRYLKELKSPGSNQYIYLQAADPRFFELLSDYMEWMVLCKTGE